MTQPWYNTPARAADETVRAAALAHQAELTKPPGALGQLEEVAVQLAALQGVVKPSVDRIYLSVFAADHGVAAEGVSLFPQAVTAEMIKNFVRGGAAISVMARQIGATMEVVDVGAVVDVGPLNGVVSARVASGSRNLAREAAMSRDELEAALGVGREAIQRAVAAAANLFIAGDMGIANTTPSTALLCAWLDQAPAAVTGPGTGLDSDGVSKKAAVIARALKLHGDHINEPFEVLRRLGGLEIAAITGAYIGAAQQGIVSLVDGFIATAAALAAVRLNPSVRPWLLFSHASAEPGHAALLAGLDARPLLDLGMRLGEGSGAAVAAQVVRMAVATHNQMATFAEAGVSEGAA